MKTWIKLLLLGLLLSVNAAPQAASPKGALTGFIGRSGTKFTKDGCPFYFHGANTFYLPYQSSELIASTLEAAKASNLNVIRTWAFMEKKPDGFDVLYQSFDAKTDSTIVNQDTKTGLGALDRVVAEAKTRGIKLILALTNNWDHYGGMDMYNDWFKAQYHDDFYDTSSRQFEAYKKYVSALLNRVNHITGVAYKDEPTIMAWELANEPRCHSKDGGPARVPKEYEASPYCNAKKITAWVDAASAYIKSIDSNHLVALGDEGFGMNTPPEFKTGLSNGALWPFENKEGVDAEANLGLPNIDFGTFHLYPENWLATLPQEHETFSVNYINYHASLAKKLDKPVFLEEYGAKPEDPEKQKHYSYIQNAVAKNADIGGSMFWAFAAEPHPYMKFGDYVVYASEVPSLMGDHIKAMQDRNAKCTA